jgi:hypothetical protein
LKKQQHSHAVEQQVEWLYAFDVHCNSFFPLFLLLYVVQYMVSPVLLAHNFLANILSIALYVIAFAYYHYLTFLGYAALPFIDNSQVFLWPMAIVLAIVPFAILGGFNPTRFTLAIYFGK